MSKSNRGKGIRSKPGRARGACPICRRTGTKLLYDVKKSEEETVTVCKRCRKTKTAQTG